MDRRLNPLDEKFRNDRLKFEPIKNKNLVCKDCKKRYDDTELPCNTSKCEAFARKPNEVLDGKDCIEYEKEG
ncbi:MAG: hypothetical protein J6Q94_00095 [Clostridia bacterium]|nr:hypothetical protein [Clostridia bacterium]